MERGERVRESSGAELSKYQTTNYNTTYTPSKTSLILQKDTYNPTTTSTLILDWPRIGAVAMSQIHSLLSTTIGVYDRNVDCATESSGESTQQLHQFFLVDLDQSALAYDSIERATNTLRLCGRVLELHSPEKDSPTHVSVSHWVCRACDSTSLLCFVRLLVAPRHHIVCDAYGVHGVQAVVDLHQYSVVGTPQLLPTTVAAQHSIHFCSVSRTFYEQCELDALLLLQCVPEIDLWSTISILSGYNRSQLRQHSTTPPESFLQRLLHLPWMLILIEMVRIDEIEFSKNVSRVVFKVCKFTRNSYCTLIRMFAIVNRCALSVYSYNNVLVIEHTFEF